TITLIGFIIREAIRVINTREIEHRNELLPLLTEQKRNRRPGFTIDLLESYIDSTFFLDQPIQDRWPNVCDLYVRGCLDGHSLYHGRVLCALLSEGREE